MTSASVVMVVVTLIGLKLLVVWLEPRMAFYPIRGVQETPATFGLAFSDVRVPTSDGETLHAWWLEDPQARAQVIFWHGNGGNLSLWLDVIAGLRRRGFSVLAVDYRGYGASSGKPTERGLYRDAEASVRIFEEHLKKPGLPVIYWGRSIGCPVAAYAASHKAPEGLLLESPMPNVRALLRTNPVLWLLSFFSSYRFPTSTFLQRSTVPLLVIHGEADGIVPFAAGRRVFADAPTAAKTFVAIPAADHNDLHMVDTKTYWQAVDAFVRTLAERPK